MDQTPGEIVRACFDAFVRKDRAALEAIIAPDFTFTSPIDDAIDRATYFSRCWPNSGHIDGFDIEKLIVDGDEVFVRYRVITEEGTGGRNVENFIVRGGQIHSVHVYFGADTAASADEEEIRGVIDAYAGAIREKNPQIAIHHSAPAPVNFLLAPPLVATGPAEQEMAKWFATFHGGIGYDLRDLVIHASGDTAFAHSLAHLTGTKTTGEKTDVWFRQTIGLTKSGGDRWRICHIHESVPFLMDGSGKAALDLQP